MLWLWYPVVCYLLLGVMWLAYALIGTWADPQGDMLSARSRRRLAVYLILAWPHALWVATTQLEREREDG